jgi:hypothetical protein
MMPYFTTKKIIPHLFHFNMFYVKTVFVNVSLIWQFDWTSNFSFNDFNIFLCFLLTPKC